MLRQTHWRTQVALVGGDGGVQRRGNESAWFGGWYDQGLRPRATPGFVFLPLTLNPMQIVC